jgi:hypothetical protein
VKAVAAVGGTAVAVVMVPLAALVAIGALVASVLSPLGFLFGGGVSFGAPVNLGVVRPPAEIVRIDEAVATAPASLVPCHVPAVLLLAQQYEESGYHPDDTPNSAGAVGVAQFLRGTFREYDHPVPPGGISPPTRRDPVDEVYAEARYLCSLGVTTNPFDAFIAYNCGDTLPACVAASSGYANNILSLARRISAPAAGRP